jgi:hypothetical protein
MVVSKCEPFFRDTTSFARLPPLHLAGKNADIKDMAAFEDIDKNGDLLLPEKKIESVGELQQYAFPHLAHDIVEVYLRGMNDTSIDVQLKAAKQAAELLGAGAKNAGGANQAGMSFAAHISPEVMATMTNTMKSLVGGQKDEDIPVVSPDTEKDSVSSWDDLEGGK